MKSFEEFAIFVYNTFASSKVLRNNEVKSLLYDHGWEVNANARIKLENSTYMDARIIHSITQMMKVVHRKTLQYNGITINYEFWDNGENMKYARFFLGYACFLIDLLDKFNERNTTLKLTLINYTGKKNVPTNDVFTSFNVNSGVTISYSNEYGEVIVYRKEEMVKVLTHELIHFYNIDAKARNTEGERPLNDMFCLNAHSTLNVNEAYTECMACMVNIIMYTILQGDKGNFLKRLAKNQQEEIKFMRGQAYKVLKVSQYDGKCTKHNQERTHAISYFVIKAALLQDMNEYVAFLSNHSFRLKDMHTFLDFIHAKVSNINWETFGKIEYGAQKNKNTMRMTTLDTVELMSKRKGYKGNIHP